MLFNSIGFAIFLPVAFLLYWFMPQKVRQLILLALSLCFYMFGGPAYVLLVIAAALVTYTAARAVEKETDEKKKKRILILALVLCIGMLVFFKYFNFAGEAVADIFRLFSVPVQPLTTKLLMPAGLSFFTFQAVGYCIDVYRGKIPAEKSFPKLLLFVSFFPQIMAGPIGRAEQLLPQLDCKREFDESRASEGLRQMLWGFSKKLLIADTLARYVNIVFDNAQEFGFFGLTLIMATVLYTFQIYCDFSGYSDIAIGTAKLFNIDLMKNFNSPYFARSVKEFWSRWHISLSTWFRDYVYIPLGGNRCSEGRNALNLMITFLLSGLWHGADWTFVIWGGLHGIYQVTENFCHRHLAKKEYRTMKERDIPRSRLWGICHGVLTFALVSFAWSFFRANSVSDALYIASHMPRGLGHPVNSYIMMLNNMVLDNRKLLILGIYILVLMTVDYFALKKDLYQAMGRWKLPLRWAVYVALTTFVIVMSLNGGTTQQFIYFQF